MRCSKAISCFRRPTLLLLAIGYLLVACLPTVQAQSALNRTRMLYTSSATYCSPPQVLLVNTVNLTLFPDNQTIDIALSAGSVENDVNVTIGVDVVAYARRLISFSLDLCTIAGGILCPLPTYQFTGGGVYPLPSSILDQIPAIAYSVPDLEALATLTLTSSTGDVVGCIQVTLSNGNTMEQPPGRWALVGLAFLALISSLLHSIIAQSVGAAQWRVVDVVMTIQHVAVTALLSLNFPAAFVSFALNFAWSIGIVDIPTLQNAITATRAATGGSSEVLLGNALTGQIARDATVWLSGDENTTAATSSDGSASTLGLPFAFRTLLATTLTSEGSSALGAAHLAPLTASGSYFTALPDSIWKRAAQYAPNTGPGGNTITQMSTGTLPLISNSSNTVDGGLSVLTQREGVPASNALLTVLVSMIIFFAIVLAAIGLTLLIVLIFRTLSGHSENSLSHWSRRVLRPAEIGYLIAATMGRCLLIVFPIFCIFSFYQWRFGDSWVPDFLAALFLAALAVGIIILFLPLFKHAWRSSAETSLYYGNLPPVLSNRATKRWGHISHPFRPRFFWFNLAFLFMGVARAAFIAFAQGYDLLQSVGLLVLEFIFFLVLCFLRVGRDKKSDIVFIVLAIFRILGWAVCIALTRRAGLTYIPRVITGFVLVVVTGIPVIYVFLFVVVVDLFSAFLPHKLRGKHSTRMTTMGEGVETIDDQEKREMNQQRNVDIDNGDDPTSKDGDSRRPPEQRRSEFQDTTITTATSSPSQSSSPSGATSVDIPVQHQNRTISTQGGGNGSTMLSDGGGGGGGGDADATAVAGPPLPMTKEQGETPSRVM